MQKKGWCYEKMGKHLAYYIAVPLIFAGMLYGVSMLVDVFGDDSLGAAIFVTYGFLFVMTPVLTAVLMRFSMLPWVVDPIAAAELPVFLLFAMLESNVRRSGSLVAAWERLTGSLSRDGGSGWWFLAGLFLFGLVCTISFRRAQGDHLPGRIWKIVREKRA